MTEGQFRDPITEVPLYAVVTREDESGRFYWVLVDLAALNARGLSDPILKSDSHFATPEDAWQHWVSVSGIVSLWVERNREPEPESKLTPLSGFALGVLVAALLVVGSAAAYWWLS